ncbi:MAG TPA: MFS transporter [Thermaerobacter sp.]
MPGVLKDPVFRLLWFGRFASLFGTRFSDLALPWVLLQSTASPWQVALVVACEQAATFLLSLPAGAWVERQRKRDVALAAETLRFAVMLLLAVLVFFDELSSWTAGLALFVMGAAGLFFSTAYRPLLVFAVGRNRLPAAYNLNEGADAVSTLLGPVAAGALMTAFGPTWALAVDALSYLISLATLMAIRVREPASGADDERPAGTVRERFRASLAGFRYILGHPVPGTLVGIGSLLGFSAVASSLLVTVLVQQDLRWSAAQAGWIYSAMGAGNVTGVVVLGWMQRAVPWAMLLAAALLAAAGGAAVLAFSTTFPAALLGAFLLDGALSVAFVVQASHVPVFTPDRLLARVHAAASLADDTARLLARLFAGGLAETLGVRAAFLACALLLGGGAVLAHRTRIKEEPVAEVRP